MRVCVYTALTGAYELLNEQPVAKSSGIPFICFSDNPALVSETWQIRQLHPLLEGDDFRNQRRYKLQPHRFLNEFDASIYIDNSVLLKVRPEEIFTAFAPASGLYLPAHSFRKTLLDEFLEVAKDRLDTPGRIVEQLANYRSLHSEILNQRPFWNGILLRDHRSRPVQAAMRMWLTHIYRYSRRDQLSAPVAFAVSNLQPDLMVIDNHDSWLHSWPHLATRQTARRLWKPETEAEELAAQLLVQDQEATALQADQARLLQQFEVLLEQHRVLLESASWRATAPARAVVDWVKQRIKRTS